MNSRMAATWFIFWLLLSHQQCQSQILEASITAFDLAMTLYWGIQSLAAIKDQTEVAKLSDGDQQIIDKLVSLSQDVEDMKNDIIDKIDKALTDKLTEKVNKLFDYVNEIQLLYEVFLNFFVNDREVIASEEQKFAEDTTRYNIESLWVIASKIHEVLVDVDFRKESIVSLIANKPPYEYMCIRGQTAQQLIYSLYTLVEMSSVKAMVMMLHSYDVIAETERNRDQTGKFEHLKNEVKDLFHSHLTKTSETIKQKIKGAPREFWRCDPKEHKINVTYSKLQVFQGFYMNQYNTPHDEWYSVFHSCLAMKDERLRCKDKFCSLQPKPCTGHLRNCEKLANSAHICYAPADSDRRYVWMEDAQGKVYGHDDSCSKPQAIQQTSDWIFKFCFCNCESEKRDADRYFSLRSATSDVEDNKVVTGVRLIKDNHVFHIQIQQGRLQANGTISGTPEWKAVSKISTNELLSKDVSIYHYIEETAMSGNVTRHTHMPIYGYYEWTDFYNNKLVYPVTYDRKTVLLDKMEVDADEVVTGLRFQNIGGNLRLEVQATEFDYSTGELDVDSNSWTYNSNSLKDRDELELSKPDDPIQTKGYDVFSDDNQYVKFRSTDLHKDLAQYTVPFLDLQEVVNEPSLPLSGAQLFYKGRKNSGGFLGFKLFHHDFSVRIVW